MKTPKKISVSNATENIIIEINEIIKIKQSCVVSIDGNCGSGKTSLASVLKELLNCNIFHTDDYFLPKNMRTKARFATPGGNIDYERFNAEIIQGINSGKDFQYYAYSCKTDEFLKRSITYKPISIIEGAYSLHPLWQDKIDLKIFMSIDYDKQIERIKQRNGNILLENFIKKWIPLEQKYFDYYCIKDKADIIVFS